jgi:AcrR family transcriptional regulator
MKRSDVKRRYDASGRRAAAGRTRAAILQAARELFLARGYARTTVADIARAAEVAVDTVYASIGTKQTLFRELIEVAISGSDRAIPAEERDYVRAIVAATEARDKLAIYAHAVRRIHARLAPLLRVLQEAATAEPELAQLWKEIADRRAANMRRFAAVLAVTGELAEDLDGEAVADTVWVTAAAEVYLLLVDERGWSPERFEAWLLRSWTRLLLRDGGGG